MIVGGTDGVFHALQVNTGKPAWSIDVSKRAILNSVLFRDNIVYLTHGEENIDTTEMGMIAAIDATGAGQLTGAAIKWVTRGFLPTFSSPVMDGERLYAVDNSAILGAFDLKTGKQVWTKRLGTMQKGSPVLADGKIYVGTENGKFYILRPTATGAEVLDEDLIGRRRRSGADHRVAGDLRRPRLCDDDGAADAAAGRTATSTPSARGGARGRKRPVSHAARGGFERSGRAGAGVSVRSAAQSRRQAGIHAEAVRREGELHPQEPATGAQWTLDLLQGTVGPDGTYVAPAAGSAGFVKATIGDVSGQARVRVMPPLPLSYDFEGIKAAPMWWTANPKATAGQIDGRRRAGAAARRHRRPPRQAHGRPARLVELHDRSRRPRHRSAPPARRHRPRSTSATCWCSSATISASSSIRGRPPTR